MKWQTETIGSSDKQKSKGMSDHWTDNINNSIVNTLSDSTCDNILHTLPRDLFTSLPAPAPVRAPAPWVAGISGSMGKWHHQFFFFTTKDCTQRVAGLRANRTEIATLSIHIVMCDLKSEQSRTEQTGQLTLGLAGRQSL